jgi:hypothetical protein
MSKYPIPSPRYTPPTSPLSTTSPRNSTSSREGSFLFRSASALFSRDAATTVHVASRAVMKKHVEDPIATSLPVLSLFMFLAFGWSSKMPATWLGRLWLRSALPLLCLMYLGYAVLQGVKVANGIPPSTTLGLPICCFFVGICIFFTFSSLSSLSNILIEVFQNGMLEPVKRRVIFVERSIWVTLVIFEAAALYSSITNTFVTKPGNYLINRTDDILFAVVVPVLGVHFVVIMACYHVVIALHSAQTQLLAFHWRRRTSSPLLLTDTYQPPSLSFWNAAFLNLVAFTDIDPLFSCARPVVSTSTHDHAEELPLSTVVAQFIVVRRSLSSSVHAWQFPLVVMLYFSCGYTLFFTYWALVVRNVSGVPFTILQPIINALVLFPLAQLNSNWVHLSKTQLDYNTARYSNSEQLLLLQLQMKQPLSALRSR